MATIDEYLKHVTPPQKTEFERIRKIVKSLVPESEETITYGIPTFKYKGKYLIYFGAFKNHMSIFPGAPLSLKQKLKGYKLLKGTIQFTEENPLPASIIRELVKNRLTEISAGKKNY